MQVLYEDNHVIVVNKASGEIVQGDKTGEAVYQGSLCQARGRVPWCGAQARPPCLRTGSLCAHFEGARTTQPHVCQW